MRVWENGGCVATIQVPPELSPSSSSKTTPLLDAEPRRLLYIIPPSDDDDSDDGLQLLIFMPSANGGYFSLYRLSAKGGGGTRALQHIGTKGCSEDENKRHIRDYLVAQDVLWVLWDEQGRSTVEFTDMDLDTEDDADWTPISSVPETELSTTHFEDHLATHGSFSITYLSSLLRPGMFSRYTLRAALQQYIMALHSLPGPKSHILTSPYTTLSEQMAAVVGSTVDLAMDPQTGEQLWNPYWNALKRDWEGFVARCREIERNARWPLALGLTHHGEPLVIERERIAAVVHDDRAMHVHSTLSTPSSEEGAEMSDGIRLMRTAAMLRAGLTPLENLALDKVMLDATRQDAAFSYLDVSSDLARLHLMDVLPDDVITAVTDALDSFKNVEASINEVLEDIIGVDRVKLEDSGDEEESGTDDLSQRTWQTALTAAYLSSTIQARHETALSLFALALFVAERRPESISSEPSILGRLFAAVQSIAILQYIARHPAGDPETPSILHEEDDVAALLQGMDVSGSSVKRNIPTYSLMHLVVLPYVSTSASQSWRNVSPGAAAHRFLVGNGLLRPRDMPVAAMPEVQFIYRLWNIGHREVAREVAEWVPKTPSIGYLFGRIWLECGRTDDAARILERVGDCTGELILIHFRP